MPISIFLLCLLVMVCHCAMPRKTRRRTSGERAELKLCSYGGLRDVEPRTWRRAPCAETVAVGGVMMEARIANEGRPHGEGDDQRRRAVLRDARRRRRATGARTRIHGRHHGLAAPAAGVFEDPSRAGVRPPRARPVAGAERSVSVLD